MVYSLLLKQVQGSLQSYKQEEVISLVSCSTQAADYLVVTSRTACVLYIVCEYSIVRMSAYILNSLKHTLMPQ